DELAVADRGHGRHKRGGRERGPDGAAVGKPAVTAAAAAAPLAALAAVDFVAGEPGVADDEARTDVRDGSPEGRAAGPAGVAGAASSASPAVDAVAVEGAMAHRPLGIVFEIQSTTLARAAVSAVGGGGNVGLVAGEGAVVDRHGGLAQVPEEAAEGLVRL